MVRRAFRWMGQARYRPEDFTYQMALTLARALPGALPGAWGGIQPPITIAGRHERIDDFMAQNPYRSTEESGSFLDIGCGFPPLTTVDTARRFPRLSVLGIDPTFGQYLVYDSVGDFASFDTEGELRFVMYGQGGTARMVELLKDIPATRARFTLLRNALLPLLPSGDGPAEAATADGRIVRDPVSGFTTTNLSFRETAIGAAGLQSVDLARCMNVLGYFDRTFYARARSWVGSLLTDRGIFVHGYNSQVNNAMYFTWQRQGHELIPVEFAIEGGILRAASFGPYYGIQDDDEEQALWTAMLGALWAPDADANFRPAFDSYFDSLLSELGLSERRDDGFLGGIPSDLTGVRLWDAWHSLDARIDADGWIARAAEVLQWATGKRAWRNCIGHLAVDPTEWGWEPASLGAQAT